MKGIIFKTLHFFIDARIIQKNIKIDLTSIDESSTKATFSTWRAYDANRIITPLYED